MGACPPSPAVKTRSRLSSCPALLPRPDCPTPAFQQTGSLGTALSLPHTIPETPLAHPPPPRLRLQTGQLLAISHPPAHSWASAGYPCHAVASAFSSVTWTSPVPRDPPSPCLSTSLAPALAGKPPHFCSPHLLIPAHSPSIKSLDGQPLPVLAIPSWATPLLTHQGSHRTTPIPMG